MKPNYEITKLKEEVKSAIERGDNAIRCADEIHKSIMNEIKEVKEKMTSIEIQIASLPEKLAEKFDERYANKNTEIAVNRLMWIVITTVMGALLSLIFIEFK